MNKPTCSVDECESASHCKGLCGKHYARFERHGDPLVTINRPRASRGARSACEIEECGRKVKGHGYCQMHYQRFKKTGDPLRNPSGLTLEIYADGDTCRADECDSRPAKRWLCGKHYQRLINHGDTETVLHREGCIVGGCKGKHCSQGYCWKHWYRFIATGDPNVLPSGRTPTGTYSGCVVDGCERGIRGGNGRCTLHAGNFKATGDALKSPGPKVKSRPCAQCGEIMDLTIPTNGRSRATSARRTCSKCRRDSDLQRWVPHLVERDGIACNICKLEVDLSLAWPHRLSRSVDHVIPWSLGGADDISNYAITHLFCNLSKHNRMELPV